MADSKIMRTISALLSIVLASSFAVVPASARESGGVRGGFWDVIYSYSDDSEYGKAVLKGLGKLTGEGACPSSETGHHVGSPYRVRKPGVRGAYSADCRCDVCGSEFSVVLNSDELSAAYDAYVQDLPATGYASDGSLLWSPALKFFYVYSSSRSSGCPHYIRPADHSDVKATCTFNCTDSSVRVVPLSGRSYFSITYVCYDFLDYYPLDGYYTLLPTLVLSGYYLKTAGSSRIPIEFSYPSSTTQFFSASTECHLRLNKFPESGCDIAFLFEQAHAPVYKVIPVTALGDTTYNINSRPASINGDYGIIGDDGKIIKVEGNTIVNETNNMYFNPATGQSFPISDWSYDYPNRAYNLTLDNGDTATVTYGDENLTIVEGDTVYNVYYLTEDTGEVPADCPHEWSKTGTTPAACTVPGSITYTCSLCSQTKTETVPASGHTWQVKQTVTTQYDETGNLVTQGYTLYECSVCHEQYKDDGGAGPPSAPGSDDPSKPSTIGGLIEKLLSGVGSVVGGLIKGILSLLTKAVEALAEIGTLFTQFTETVVSIFGGFTSFLSAVFPFLPEEFFTIFTLGALLLVAAAVLKKFLS